MVRRVVALARGSSMKNVAVYIPSPLGIDTLYMSGNTAVTNVRVVNWVFKALLTFSGRFGPENVILERS